MIRTTTVITRLRRWHCCWKRPLATRSLAWIAPASPAAWRTLAAVWRAWLASWGMLAAERPRSSRATSPSRGWAWRRTCGEGRGLFVSTPAVFGSLYTILLKDKRGVGGDEVLSEDRDSGTKKLKNTNNRVMGSFDGWTRGESLSPALVGTETAPGLGTEFSGDLRLRPGRYEIKFVVDGVWQVLLPLVLARLSLVLARLWDLSTYPLSC